MSRKVMVKSVGQTDTHTNATANENPTGSLTVSTTKRGVISRTTYAHGRWTHYTEDGVE